MKTVIIASLILVCFGVVLVNNPMQLFERNYPDTKEVIKKNTTYMKIIKVIGYMFIIAGIILFVLDLFIR